MRPSLRITPIFLHNFTFNPSYAYTNDRTSNYEIQIEQNKDYTATGPSQIAFIHESIDSSENRAGTGYSYATQPNLTYHNVT